MYVESAVDPADKSVETMRKFSEQYARRSDTFFCVDKSVTSVVIKVHMYMLKQTNIIVIYFLISFQK